MKLIQNNGKPRAVTIYQDQIYDYMTKATSGKFQEYRIVVAMKRPDMDFFDKEDNLEVNPILKWTRNLLVKYNKGLTEMEKIYIRFRRDNANGDFKYVDEKRVDNNDSYTVENYPHIIGFKRGNDMKDEKEYNILVGQTAEIDNDIYAEEMMKTFGFIDSVNGKGEINTEIQYPEIFKRRKISSPKDYMDRQTPTTFEQVPHTANPGRPKNAPEPVKPQFE